MKKTLYSSLRALESPDSSGTGIFIYARCGIIKSNNGVKYGDSIDYLRPQKGRVL
jgi:hypothetical protein